MPVRLLCIGDIHLGRRPSRIPDLTEWSVSPGELTPAAAFARAVDLAIEHRVAAVVLAGDVVESDNQFFEAYGPLLAGVTRLVARGIEVIGVAGNHDVQVLPRLADEVPGFRLLGRGGVWEEHVVRGEGNAAVRLLGWSFPERVVRASPLQSVPAARDAIPTVGVLHCDLDAPGSVYAPITSAALRDAPGDAWLLGHIHQPSVSEGPSPRGYLGNLSSLDPGELGQRGAWILDVDGPGRVAIRRLAISRVRWEQVDLDVSELERPEELDAALSQRVRALHTELRAGLGEARVVGCRVRLTGATSWHAEMIAWCVKFEARNLRVPLDGCVYFVESVTDDARLAIDLDAVARGSDPPGLLAAMLLDVERETDAGREIIRKVATELERATASPSFAALEPIRDPMAHARRHIRRAGLLALEDLLAQRETS